MSRHSFDPEIAKKVGINAAILFQNISWWCEKNAANNRNIHDGKAWTYNSIAAFAELFPYFTTNQIRTALDKLEESGLIEVGNFNKTAMDRTKWYAVPHLGKNPNGFGLKDKPIPDSKPDIKQTPIPPKGDDLFTADSLPINQDTISECFEEFWNLYPKSSPINRKANRKGCLIKFREIVTGKSKRIDQADAETIIRGLKGYIASEPDPQYIPAPMVWLNGAKWEAYQEQIVDPRAERYRRIAGGN